eukprot:g73457.t1
MPGRKHFTFYISSSIGTDSVPSTAVAADCIQIARQSLGKVFHMNRSCSCSPIPNCSTKTVAGFQPN